MDVLFIFLIVSLILNVTLIVVFGLNKRKKPDVVGTVIMFDAENLYLELDNKGSLKKMYQNDYAMFRIERSQIKHIL